MNDDGGSGVAVAHSRGCFHGRPQDSKQTKTPPVVPRQRLGDGAASGQPRQRSKGRNRPIVWWVAKCSSRGPRQLASNNNRQKENKKEEVTIGIMNLSGVLW